jgi:hypothetical protein
MIVDLRTLNKKRLFLAIIIIVSVCIVLGIIATVTYNTLNKNPYGQGIVINDFNKKVKNLPSDRVESISAMLYNTVQLNLKDGQEMPNIPDANIREGSEKQDEVTKNAQYSGSFIVDIESIRQSYKVTYSYSKDPNDDFMSGYPVGVSCLDGAEVIYKDFQCKDLTSEESKGVDPIIYRLPHDTLTYRITALEGDDATISLQIDLYLSSVDLSDSAAAIQQYKLEALTWIESQGFNPDDYQITYSH